MSEEPEEKGSLGRGFAIGAGVNIGFVLLILLADKIRINLDASFASGLLAFLLFGIGLAQFLWLAPLYWRFRQKGKTETAKGILLTAGITLLLNGACWLTVWNQLTKYHG